MNYLAEVASFMPVVDQAACAADFHASDAESGATAGWSTARQSRHDRPAMFISDVVRMPDIAGARLPSPQNLGDDPRRKPVAFVADLLCLQRHRIGPDK